MQSKQPVSQSAPIRVLKFGSSVLRDAGAYRAAAAEVYRFVRRGERVLVVASALGEVTDQLITQLDQSSGETPPAMVARLARLGEYQSTALFGAAVSEIGLRVTVIDPHEIGLQAQGDLLDAEPVNLGVESVNALFMQHEVVIVPGFSAGHVHGGCALFGRGGSDLSAVFIAAKLKLRSVRLLKDVDGIYAENPGRNPQARRFEQVSYEQALTVSEGLVQAKAIALAKATGLRIEIGALGANTVSSICSEPALRSVTQLPARNSAPLRVALLGCGAVGRGVLSYLLRWPERFILNPVLVRDVHKPERQHIPGVTFTDDIADALQQAPDIVIELIGGEHFATEIMQSAFQKGWHVVTANKAAVAANQTRLHDSAAKAGCHFAYAASVGGGVPILENLAALAQSGRKVRKVSGIVNGTANYVLGKLSEGTAFNKAIRLAQDNGFAEADPSADIDGSDAAAKIAVIAYTLGQPLNSSDITKQSLVTVSPEQVTRLAAQGQCYKQISTLDLCVGQSNVTIEPIAAEHTFAKVHNEHNCFQIEMEDGEVLELHGKGAGCWPTAAAVFADVMDIWCSLHGTPSALPANNASAGRLNRNARYSIRSQNALAAGAV